MEIHKLDAYVRLLTSQCTLMRDKISTKLKKTFWRASSRGESVWVDLRLISVDNSFFNFTPVSKNKSTQRKSKWITMEVFL